MSLDSTIINCYKKIYDWHSNNSNKRMEKEYTSFLQKIPSPENVEKKDMTVVFNEVITGYMEWSYSEEHEGKTMSEYASEGLKEMYGDNWYNNPDFEKIMKESELYKMSLVHNSMLESEQ